MSEQSTWRRCAATHKLTPGDEARNSTSILCQILISEETHGTDDHFNGLASQAGVATGPSITAHKSTGMLEQPKHIMTEVLRWQQGCRGRLVTIKHISEVLTNTATRPPVDSGTLAMATSPCTGLPARSTQTRQVQGQPASPRQGINACSARNPLAVTTAGRHIECRDTPAVSQIHKSHQATLQAPMDAGKGGASSSRSLGMHCPATDGQPISSYSSAPHR